MAGVGLTLGDAPWVLAALLATLTVAGGALISSLILIYSHIQQRRTATPTHWPQVGDHSGQQPGTRRAPW